MCCAFRVGVPGGAGDDGMMIVGDFAEVLRERERGGNDGGFEYRRYRYVHALTRSISIAGTLQVGMPCEGGAGSAGSCRGVDRGVQGEGVRGRCEA